MARLGLDSRPVKGAAITALVFLALWTPIEIAQAASAVVPVVHLDGAYQTFNGLLRLSSGQLPGRDFFPYLGIGTLATLWPVYALLGSTVASSLFAATLMAMLALQAAFATTAALVFRTRSWLFALTAALVPVVVVQFAGGWLSSPSVTLLNVNAFAELSSPGNSLRPIRAFAPYLLAFLVLVITGLTTNRPIRRALLLGMAAGAVGAVWSNDYALVSASLLLVLVTLNAVANRPRWRGIEVVALWLASALTFVIVGVMVTGGNFLRLLGYNLVDVRGDQYWYFGPWDTGYRINSPVDLFWTMRAENSLWTLALLAILAGMALWRRDKWLGLLTYLGGALFLGGVAATVGGHAGGYFTPFRLWGVMALALLLAHAVVLGWLRLRVRFPRGGGKKSYTRLLRLVLPLSIVVAAIAAATDATSNRQSADSRLATDAAFVYDDQLGGYLDQRFATLLQQVPDSPVQLLEEYSGLSTAMTGPRSDTAVDSVIHALGRQRTEYLQVLQGRPETVVTSSIDMGEWVTWNLSANWWFYRDLFMGYEPQQSSPTTYTWRPSAGRVWPSVPCTVEDNQARVRTSHKGLYEVVVRYEGPGSGSRTFSMIRNGLNAGADAGGYVALDPAALSQAFPVYSPDGGELVLDLKDIGPTPSTGAPVTALTSCSASKVELGEDSAIWALYGPLFEASTSPANFTDGNWTAGVGNDLAAFFIPFSGANDAAVQGITHVKFASGSTRKVTDVVFAGPYINIYLEGPPLDPSREGYPNTFSLIRK